MTELSRVDIKNLRHHYGIRGDDRHVALCDMALAKKDAEAECERLEKINTKLRDRITRLQHRLHNAAECLDGGMPTDRQIQAATPPPEGEPSMRALTCPGCDSRFWEANNEKRIEWTCPRCDVPLEREFDAPHTPEQTEASPLSRLVAYAIHGGMDMPEADECRRQLLADNTPAEQAHGDALQGWDVDELLEHYRGHVAEAAQGGETSDDAAREADAAEAIIRQALTASGVPEGYKLVPVEPTKEMIYEGVQADAKGMTLYGGIENAYRAMIAAAPTDGRES